MDNIKESSQTTMDKVKDSISTSHTTVEYRFEMPGLIDQALFTLQEFLSPHLVVEEQIPIKILSGAKAVVFLTVVKGGVGISGAVGTGMVIARNEKGKWSGPCAILLAGVDIGLNIGIEKSDHIIILRDEKAIRAFESVGQLKLGLDASIAAGPKGRDASIGVHVGDKGYAATVSYSMAKGVYLGLSLEGQIITIRNDCNEQYYGKQVEPGKILDGTVKAPKNKNLEQIYKILDTYEQKEEI
jgi:lipid-binding SYLF domain-containing protein